MVVGDAVIRRPEDLTGDWLTSVLRAPSITSFTTEPVGTGQMSDSFRVQLRCPDDDGAGPPSVVLKVASSDPRSRSTGTGLGAYEREIRFYREVAPGIRGPVAVCHHASFDPNDGWFTLLLEDAAPAQQGDQIAHGDRNASNEAQESRFAVFSRRAETGTYIHIKPYVSQDTSWSPSI